MTGTTNKTNFKYVKYRFPKISSFKTSGEYFGM